MATLPGAARSSSVGGGKNKSMAVIKYIKTLWCVSLKLTQHSTAQRSAADLQVFTERGRRRKKSSSGIISTVT